MFGLGPGRDVCSEVFTDGAEGKEKRAVEPAGDRWSTEAREEEESTEKRG